MTKIDEMIREAGEEAREARSLLGLAFNQSRLDQKVESLRAARELFLSAVNIVQAAEMLLSAEAPIVETS